MKEKARTTGLGPDSAATEREPIQVLIVDDHELFRTGLADLLGQEGFDVVAAVGDGESALAVVAEQAPDVVLMDLEMPGISGVEATRRIAEIAPRTRVLMLTISAEEQAVVEAITAGACGYLLKASLESVVAGINSAVAGEAVISAAVASKLFERVRIENAERAAGLAGIDLLSERERQIMKLIAGGRRNTDIAEELMISPHTVRNHVSNILGKLQIANRIEAAVYAIRHHLA